MRTVVIGGTGMIGQHLLPILRHRGHRLTVMAPGERLASLPGEFDRVRGSLLADDAESMLAGLLRGCDTVVNLASAVPADPAAPGAWQTNTRIRRQGTETLVRAVAAAGVPQLVQMSITMAYGDGGDSWLDEDTPFDPDPARISLVAPVAELEATIRGLPPRRTAWTILRGSRLVGPGTIQDNHCAQARAGSLVVPGNGDSFASMVHSGDFATAVAAAVETGLAGAVLNVSARPVRLGEYFDRLADVLAVPRPPRERDRAPDVPSQRVSTAAARRLLRWRPLRPLWPPAHAPA